MQDDFGPATVGRLTCRFLVSTHPFNTAEAEILPSQSSEMGGASSDPTDLGDITYLSSAPVQSASYPAHFSANELVYEPTIRVYGLVINRSGWFIVFMN